MRADRPRLVLVTRKTPLELLLERHGRSARRASISSRAGRPEAMPRILDWLERRDGPFRIERRAMAVAEREDGQRLLALNEVFVGHRSHQSARYRLTAGPADGRSDGRAERQSSSGLICATGTGSTGWALSVARERGLAAELPGPEEPRLAWFVREPWPSAATGVGLDHGWLGPGERLSVASEMPEDGVVFADGIESDRLELLAGQTIRVGLAERVLNLVVPAA